MENCCSARAHSNYQLNATKFGKSEDYADLRPRSRSIANNDNRHSDAKFQYTYDPGKSGRLPTFTPHGITTRFSFLGCLCTADGSKFRPIHPFVPSSTCYEIEICHLHAFVLKQPYRQSKKNEINDD